MDKDGLKTPWKTVSSTPSWVAGKNKSETWRHMIASTSLIQFSLFFFLITKIWYPAIWHRSKFPPQEDNEVVFSVNLSSGVNVGNISYLMKLLRGKCDRLIANFRVSVPDRYAIQFLQKKLLFFPDESRFLSLCENRKFHPDVYLFNQLNANLCQTSTNVTHKPIGKFADWSPQSNLTDFVAFM